uniref:Uncharacterized protein n=1 Tax=Fagus sylvatica TaxID=28930 RepID=A0A2N9EGL1_FAGSY
MLLETTSYLLNLVPSKSVPKTPVELWNGRKPSMRYLHIWECPTHVLKGKSDKLEAKTKLCLFVGYPKGTRGGLFYSQKDNKVFISTNAKYLEEDYVENFKPRSRIILEQMSDIVDQPSSTIRDDVVVLDTPQDTINETNNTLVSHRSGRIIRPLGRFTFLGEAYEAILEITESDPKTYEEAINDIDPDHWLKAMDSKLGSMYSNKVWELVIAPNGIKLIGCKWIYKRKERDRWEVAMLKSIRILLSIVAHLDYEIWQMDVKTAFLNGNLDENIYMMQPYGLHSKESGAHGVQVAKILSKFSMQDSKKGLLPTRHGVPLSEDHCPKTPQEEEHMRTVLYASAVEVSYHVESFDSILYGSKTDEKRGSYGQNCAKNGSTLSQILLSVVDKTTYLGGSVCTRILSNRWQLGSQTETFKQKGYFNYDVQLPDRQELFRSSQNLNQKMTHWHVEHSNCLCSRDRILRTQAHLCATPILLERRVFLTHNELIRKPRHIGKRTCSDTTWNSRIVKIFLGLSGIFTGKMPSDRPKTLRRPLFAGPYLSVPNSVSCKSKTLRKRSPSDSLQVEPRAQVHWKDDDSSYDLQLSVRRWLPPFDRNLRRKNMQKQLRMVTRRTPWSRTRRAAPSVKAALPPPHLHEFCSGSRVLER